ncbi:MAG: ABC transporter permease [Algiphilus sp.]
MMRHHLSIDLAEALLLALGTLLLAGALFGLFVAFAGEDPAAVFYSMYQGAFGTWFSWQDTLQRATPFMLTALCTALPARLGLLVIGNEGALVVGGITAALTGIALSGTAPLFAQTGMFLAAAMAGGVWIGAVIWLRHYRGVNETISSLLLNYIAIAILLHLVNGPLRDPSSLNKPSTPAINEASMLGAIPGLDVHWGLVYGVLACLLLFAVFRYTTVGFAARMIGGNIRAAQMNGIAVGPLLLTVGCVAGAAAGLAGMLEVAAVHGRANDSLVVGYGYVGILVAFLARHNLLMIVPVAILFGGIEASGGLLQRRFDLPDATVTVLQGLIFLLILVSETFRGRLLPRPHPGVA